MGINRRLLRLEGRSYLDWCPDCGAWLGPLEEAEIIIEWYDDPDNQPTEAPTVCPTCLEPDFIVVRWLDIEDELEDRRLSKEKENRHEV